MTTIFEKYHKYRYRQTKKVQAMRRRKKPSRRRDSVIEISNDKGGVLLNSDGTVIITGDVKSAALAFTKHILDNYNGYTKQVINKYLVVNCMDRQNYTLDWVTSDWATSINPPTKPAQWAEFKEEFERICKLKAFI